MTTELNTPWTLTIEQDGTEDVGTIHDADGLLLVTSHHFWLPEGDDPVPPTLAALRLMAAAPTLLEVVRFLLVDRNSVIDYEARLIAEAALAEVEGIVAGSSAA